MQTMQTIKDQTDYIRSNPLQLCQSIPHLVQVVNCTYNLNNPAFIAYLTRRGVGGYGRKNSAWRALLQQYEINIDLIRLIYVYDVSGNRFTASEQDSAYTRALIARGKLQDAWELYTSTTH